MESKAKLVGHAIHPMLIVFPLGLLGMAVVFDILQLATANVQWSQLSYWMIPAGIVTGLLAAPFGLIDWLALPSGSRAWSVGLYHGVGNVVVLVLFAASWWMRGNMAQAPGTLALALSFAGVVLALVTGWLGGELVDRLGVGVDEGAHINAPNSLVASGTHATGHARRA